MVTLDFLIAERGIGTAKITVPSVLRFVDNLQVIYAKKLLDGDSGRSPVTASLSGPQLHSTLVFTLAHWSRCHPVLLKVR